MPGTGRAATGDGIRILPYADYSFSSQSLMVRGSRYKVLYTSYTIL